MIIRTPNQGWGLLKERFSAQAAVCSDPMLTGEEKYIHKLHFKENKNDRRDQMKKPCQDMMGHLLSQQATFVS